MVDIIALGEPLLEFNASRLEHLSEATAFDVGHGGDTSNAAIAASRSGADVGYITRIGDDDFGTAFMRLWHHEGVGTSGVVREPGGRTGIYFISRDPANSSFTYYRAGSPASRMTIADVPEQLVTSAKALHVSGISQAISDTACDAALHAMALARRSGVLVSYDPNHRPVLWGEERARAVVGRSIELCDVALPNIEEGRLFSGAETPGDVLDWFVRRGPRVVVLKMGADGALLHHDGRIEPIAPHRVTPVDSTGAGDTFDGSFLARLVAGDSPPNAARYAAVAAALATQGLGAVDPIPTRSAVFDALGGA